MFRWRVFVAALLAACFLLQSGVGWAGPPAPSNHSKHATEPIGCACPLQLESEHAVQAGRSLPETAPPRRIKPPALIVLNLRQASAKQLEWLPRIGPASAQRIIELRQRKPLLNLSDLAKVKGIGRKTMALLRPWLTVSGPSLICPASCDTASGKTDPSTIYPTSGLPIAPEFSSCQDHLPLTPAG